MGIRPKEITEGLKCNECCCGQTGGVRGQAVVKDGEVIGKVSLPIATLDPFVGIGLFTGIAEAFLRKPRGFAISRTCTPT